MLSAMARPAFTLAALATAAIPGLEVASCRPRSSGTGGDFDSAEIVARDGQHLIVRVPRHQRADRDQSADLVALAALTAGARARLPFEIPEVVGQTPVGPTRAVVYRFIPGEKRSASALTGTTELAGALGAAIGAIHALPTAVVRDAGLPVSTAAAARADTAGLIADAGNTGRVPAALLRRWDEAIDTEAMWQFTPTVINGELAADSFVSVGDHIAGVLGWSALAVGDPARDVHWLFSARGSFAPLAQDSYRLARGGSHDPALARRALLLGELELVRWLMHGISTRNDEIVADAVGLLDNLVEHVHGEGLPSLTTATGPILSVGEVERLLENTPSVLAYGDPVPSIDAEGPEPIAYLNPWVEEANEAPAQTDSPAPFNPDQVATEPIISPQREINSASE